MTKVAPTTPVRNADEVKRELRNAADSSRPAHHARENAP